MSEKKKTIMDGDILKAMTTHLDEHSVVYGANGHYAIGAYYDLTSINSAIAGDVDYNSQSNIDEAKNAQAAELFMNDNEELIEYLQKAKWMREF